MCPAVWCFAVFQVFAAEAVHNALQSQLQEAAKQLAATTTDYDEQVMPGLWLLNLCVTCK
jgi:hypothetical protein